MKLRTPGGAGWRVTAPVLTLIFTPSHGQVMLSLFSLPYTQRPAPVQTFSIAWNVALHIEERDGATIGFYDLAATRRTRKLPTRLRNA
jgi:hypothetical protein